MVHTRAFAAAFARDMQTLLPLPRIAIRSVFQTLADIETGILGIEELPTITVVDVTCRSANRTREVVSLNNRCLPAIVMLRALLIPPVLTICRAPSVVNVRIR